MTTDEASVQETVRAAPEPKTPRSRRVLPSRLLIPVRRTPFTLLLIAAVLGVSSVAGLLGRPITPDQLLHRGFGWHDLIHGDLLRLLTAPFFILMPYMGLSITAIILFFVGSCELLLKTRRTLVVFFTCHVLGYVGTLLLLNPLGRAGFERLEALLPLGLHHGPRMLLVFSGLLLLTVADALARAQRAAWWAAFLALLVTLGLQLELGVNKLEALFALVFLLLLVAWKEEFPAPGDPPSWRSARTRTAAVLLGVPLVFWVGVLVSLAQALRTLRAPHPRPGESARARQLALAHGATGTSFMAAWPGNHLFFPTTADAFLAYRVQGSIAVALGDPVGAPDTRGPALREFTHHCRSHGWSPVVLGATDTERPAYGDCGYRLLQIGEEAVLDLAGLEFKGKHWQNMRTALNRARKLGVEFRLYEGGRVPAEIEARLQDLEADWRRRQMLPPLQFTQGRPEDVRDSAVEVAVALDGEGRVHGYVDWLPVPAAKGWVIDLMRRGPDAMSGTMEFLIGMSMLSFQERGAAYISLATAPLADIDRSDAGDPVQQVLGAVFERFETFYDFRSLFDFKDRFEPRWELTALEH